MVLSRYESPAAKHDAEIDNYTTFSSDLRIHVRSKFRLVSIAFQSLILSMIVDQCDLCMMLQRTKKVRLSVWVLQITPKSPFLVSKWYKLCILVNLHPNRCWIVSPPRILLKSNFWHRRSSEKRNTRCVGNFLGRTTNLILPIQSHSGKSVHFFRTKFHEFHFTTLSNTQKSSLAT